MTLGYIGLGNMGGGIARRLQKNDPLQVHDLNTAAMQNLVALGATAHASCADLARHCDTILLCLPASPQVRTVIFGANGLASTAAPGTLIVDQTTGDPNETRAMAAELATRGIEMIDAPVSGGPRGAEAGTLSIMVGASAAQLERILPVLQTISPNIFHAGEVGNGQVIKIANNLLHHSQRLLSLEAICLAVKNGVEPRTAVDIILASSGRNYYIEQNMESRVLAGKLVSGFTLDLLQKDVRLATDLARDSGVPMFFGNLVREYYQMCISEMGGTTQVNAVALLMERLAGTHIVPPEPQLS